jgi:hypothetical protein
MVWRSRCKSIGRVLCVLALGALVSGCDRCGDFWWLPGQTQACKPEAPRPN